jgi:hypothetical protein
MNVENGALCYFRDCIIAIAQLKLTRELGLRTNYIPEHQFEIKDFLSWGQVVGCATSQRRLQIRRLFVSL